MHCLSLVGIDRADLGATAYWLYAGSTVGGAQYYSSGDVGTATSVTISTLPTDCSNVYVRLWYQAGTSTWELIDATYTAATLAGPEITAPTDGSPLATNTQLFSWTDNGAGATAYWLYVGSTPGGSQYYSQSVGTATSNTVTGLPTDGSTIYIRLWCQLNGGATKRFTDSTYTATSSSSAEITSPIPNTTLTGDSATLTWTDNGVGVEEWWVYAGTSAGTREYYDSGSLGAATSAEMSNLPQDDSTITISLWYRIGSIWQYESYDYISN